MNEFNKKLNLTNRVPTPYSKEDGDNFMEENGEEYRNSDSEESSEKEEAEKKDQGEEEKRSAQEQEKKEKQSELTGGATPFDSAKFNFEADRLKNAATRQDIKNYIDLIKTTSAQEMPQLWNQFGEYTQKIHADINDEYAKLRDTDVDKRRRAELEAEMKALETEEENVRKLMQKKAPPAMADERSLSQEQMRLVNEIEKNRKKLNAVATDAEKENVKQEIKKAANDLFATLRERPPEDYSISDEVMGAIGTDELATEKFMHRLIFMPVENESHHMSGFYSQSNLDKFLKINNPEMIGKGRYERLKALVEANQTFHNMNYVLKRSFDQFSQLAQSILPEHLEVLEKIPGVSTVFHLYERFSQEHLGVETRITQNEFNKMDDEVNEILDEINKESIISGMEGKLLADWEMRRALAYGRNLFRISVRAAEHISHSELPGRLPGLGSLPANTDIFISPPQKELVGILNFIKFTVYRFRPNEELGGFELIDSVREKRMEKRRKDGKMRIKTLQGTDVDMRSLENIVSARGLMYTWRMREALLREVKFNDGNKITNIADFFGAHKNEIAAISSDKEAEELFRPMLEGNQLALGVLVSGWAENVPAPVKTLIWKKIANLDPLVMSSLLTRLEIDKYDKQKAEGVEKLDGVQSMEEIILNKWGTNEQKKELGEGRYQTLRAELRELGEKLEKKQKEIKDMEHPAAADVPKNEKKMRDVKNSSKYKNLKEEIKQISQQYDQKKIAYAQADEVIKTLLRNEKWEVLKKKLTKANEKRIIWESTHMGEKPRPLSAWLEGDIALNQDERDVYQNIRTSGEKIAGDLANFSQASTWFMDDVPLALIKWSNMGQTYDRMVNDLGSFQKSNQGLAKIVAGRPFNEPPTEIAKHFGEAIAEAANVLGRAGAAQDNYYNLIQQYLEMIQERPKYRQLLISEFKHSRFEPTSRAQEITGSMHSPATNEEGTFDVVQHFLDQNCMRKTVKTVTDNKDDKGKITYESQVGEAIRKYHIGWWDRMIKKNVRDFGPLGLIAFLIMFFKKTFSGVKFE